MKIQGKKIEGPNEMTIVTPRFNGADIILKARAIVDMVPFEKVCTPPEPPRKTLPGGKQVPNIKDSNYLKELDRHSIRRLNWIVLTSLEATEGLEWETIDLADPSTWDNFRKELRNSGFSDIEINRIVADCISVNALDEDKIEEARERFLLAAQEQDAE